MNILLFGIFNVGKSAIGEYLSRKLDFIFFYHDELVKSDLKITLEEFVNTGTFVERDRIRCDLLNAVHYISGNKVVAVSLIIPRIAGSSEPAFLFLGTKKEPLPL